MTLKHIPGPWHVGGTASRAEIVYAPDGFAICNCVTYHGKHGAAGPSNAALIAAAPDLLEALMRLSDIIASAGVPWAEFGNALRDARAAISKATGE
jgi:hypothetical protein